MRWFVGFAVVAAAAFLPAAAGAQIKSPSGDTCASTAGTTATSYTLSIATGAGTQQYGLAVGAPGLTIQNISISGANGNFGTSSMPPGASGNWGGWTSDTPLTGTLSVTLTVTGTPTGSFTVMPEGQQGSYYDAVTCTATSRPLRKAISFTVLKPATYSASAKGWHLMVKVPTPGIVSAKQPLVIAKNTPATLKPKAVVVVHRVEAKTAGTVMLTLKLTAAGLAKLATKTSITLQLNVQFDAHDGQNGHKLVKLTLRK